ncbi:MAG: VTT domain-containing protein [Anaerolineales bacterium]|nr:VTT domain-containing protein [Anaerolineales bacterium]
MISWIKQHGLPITRVIAILIVIGLTVFIFTLSEAQIDNISGYGYIGIAVITFLAYATVLIPAPGLAVVFTMGARFDPLWIGVAAGLGGALGELSGYLAGYSGQAVIENMNVYQKMVGWMKIYGYWVVLGLALIPNPVFDVTGMTAGVLKMPVWKFLLMVWIGVTLKMIFMAYLGSGLFNIPWIQNQIH